MDEDRRIAQCSEEDPAKPGPADARLREAGTPIWALISYLDRAVGGNLEEAACDFEGPVEAVLAARAYYRRHQPLIDARIALSAA